MKKLLILLLTLQTAAQAGDGLTGEWQIVLWGGLFPKRPANLVLELEAQNGVWQRVWGTALGAGNGVHYGRVESATFDGRQGQLKVAIIKTGDQWVRDEHFVTATIELTTGADGKLTGQFTGTCDGDATAGKVTAELKPVPRLVRAGFVPVATDEHPRVLFRKTDVARLRERLNTPMGQTYWAKVDAIEKAWKLEKGRRGRGDAINMGIAYQLTREQRFADAAQGMADMFLLDTSPLTHDEGAGSGGCGHNAVILALAYDLCCDAWPADFRKAVRARLAEELPMLFRYLTCTSYANNHPCSNYYGPGYGGPAVASLVLYNDKGPAPTRPVSAIEEIKPIAPEADYQPPAGVPVVEWDGMKMPGQWLIAGPVPALLNGDVLAAIGGVERARPIAGTTAETMTFVGGRPQTTKLAFKALPAEALGAGGIDLEKLGAGEEGSTTALFTVLKVTGETMVGLVRGTKTSRVWLAGVELRSTGVYQLNPGLYPLTVVHATERAGEPISVRLAAAGGEAFAWREADQKLRETLWKEDMAAWEKTGVDQSIAKMIGVGYQRMYRHWRLGLGDGGFQAEAGPHYSEIALWYPLVYASLYPNVFGRPASPWPDVTHVLPKRLMQVFFPANEQEKPRVQIINSAAGVNDDLCAASYPIIPAAYRPAALWAWNRVAVAKNAPGKVDPLRNTGLKLALAFLNYPLDSQPEPPGKVMPLTWEASTFGYHCFRNGWEGKDEFISQVFLKASLVSGWNHPNAGTFAIQGLGREWVIGSTARVGFREQDPLVLLPEDEINEGACGRLVHRQVQPDGSGVLTVDLGDVYSAKGGRLYDGNLLRLAGRYKPSGITGLRAFAFDYSGKSGAPLLLAMADKIDGGKRRVWQWTMPKGGAAATKTTADGFVIDYGDASMKLTFITPVKPPIKAGADEVHIGQLGDGHRSFEGTVERVQAAGKDHFLVVATFQRGPAPAVKVEGEGLTAKITVGQQTVRFDGTKFIIGQ